MQKIYIIKTRKLRMPLRQSLHDVSLVHVGQNGIQVNMKPLCLLTLTIFTSHE